MPVRVLKIGKKISVTLKDIRYEGILFQNEVEMITLIDVSVLKTEETQFPDLETATYLESITFNRSEIKNIRVLDNMPTNQFIPVADLLLLRADENRGREQVSPNIHIPYIHIKGINYC
ncbi:hypothetical protein ABEB36_000586 [Hypothenemus hampei]|uniref:Lsm14-like N-terminal domain-containing protein n=1 Tax=Hypothenemus hampei TaxID=57062 RepID=A0ABD1FBQ4_HYPHA